MIRLAVLFGLVGLAVATGVILYSGFDEVMVALDQAGWGIVWTSLYHIVPLLLCVVGWRALFPGNKRPSLAFFLYLLWLRAAVNNLMPVARIGGEVVAIRVMIKHGIRKTTAVASTVVELTTSVIAVFLFCVVGVSMFTWHVGDRQLSWKLLTGLLLTVPALLAMVSVQRAGFFGLLSKIFNLMFRNTWKKFATNTAQLDRAVYTSYRRYNRVIICSFWQLMSWVSGTFETWLALYFLGHKIPFTQAFMLEALIQASTSAAFIVPGALGVQEASIVLFGHLLGLAPEIAAALAVIRRCRDILLYIPGLIVWQIQEGRWFMKKNAF